MTETWTVILAAGEGKRMRSGRAKVLHRLGGRPLIAYPVALARAVGTRGIVVVVGHQGDGVREALAGQTDLRFAEQREQRGTGHALVMAKGAVPGNATEILLLYADVPLLAETTVERLLVHHRQTRAAVSLLTFAPPDPTGYGRIVRRGGPRGPVVGIVEERDTTAAQRRLRECNSGIYCFEPRWLWPALDRLTPENDQGELYLTDVIGLLARNRRRVAAIRVDDPLEVAGVNDRRQLAELDAVLRGRTLAGLMAEGVTVLDPNATYVEPDVTVGRDTILYPGVRLEGRTVVGEACLVGTGCQLTDMTVGDRVILRPYCVAEGSVVEADVKLGPCARLRPGTVIQAGADIGNFIEIKKSTIGRRVKAHHVGYIGDATVGEGANIGAGMVTVNYDGVAKHPTTIGARAFVGTNASLVAPLNIGDDAYVGAGSVITKDVPPGALAIERAQQVIKEGWTERRRARQAASREERPTGSQ
ncbi:MAG TPA: bifunctional UDP-N-acetylglucosamine diphosphorylase/glucosamine-1-phosphate N-acetyltransferase GlmU [Methylomirabilota bacterium]|nr:bifunctional UDP-N-acetylglucosamine diphosphorylase/glucosamine-1-phosphate N-acetyltransferase GlmU [Methylomirabilota bacterium]